MPAHFRDYQEKSISLFSESLIPGHHKDRPCGYPFCCSGDHKGRPYACPFCDG